MALILTSFCCISAYSSTIYGASSTGDLYTINPTTGATTEVGSFGNGVVLYDIAEFGGKIYGVNGTSDLYSVNPTTGAATEIGATGQDFTALTFSSTGILYATGLTTTKVYTVNLTTGAATAIAGETNTTAYNAAGDLEFINGVLYMTTGGNGTNAPSTLVTVNLTTGAMTTVGAIKVGGTAVDDVFGLAEQNGILYGFTSPSGTGEVITLNTSNGAATNVAAYGGGNFTFYGTTDDAAPEPGTMGAMALGIAGLCGFSLKRRKAQF